MPAKNIGKTLKEIRLKTGITQKQAYEYIGVAQSTFSSWETGKAEPPTETLLKLCDLYQVDDILSAFGYDGYKEDGSLQLNMKEIDIVEKYRNLDPHGKEMVDFTLQKEWERSTTEPAPESNTPSTTAEIIPMRFLSYYQKMASAGRGEYLFSDIPTEVIAVPDTPLSRRADFVIGVSGRSMEDTYFDGDKVLVEKTQDVPIGKIGIFIRGNECFIKEVGENRLISHNENKKQYPDIIPDERGIDTIGIVLGKVGE